tara:strand:+ start:597 stop:794 length:198 start_codon:yes stop_codon:yes gene_type:complete
MHIESEVREMLDSTIERKKHWYDYFQSRKMSKRENAEALRNYTALRGVEKTLRWVLEEIKDTPLE